MRNRAALLQSLFRAGRDALSLPFLPIGLLMAMHADQICDPAIEGNEP